MQESQGEPFTRMPCLPDVLSIESPRQKHRTGCQQPDRCL